jgi:hypothetical protein
MNPNLSLHLWTCKMKKEMIKILTVQLLANAFKEENWNLQTFYWQKKKTRTQESLGWHISVGDGRRWVVHRLLGPM